jgi:phasin family protein
MNNGQNGFAKNPFLDFDFTKALGDLRVPGLDVDALVAAQRKNLEAVTQANQLAVEGVQAVARRQVEIARQAFDEFSAVVREFATPTASPEDRIAKQAELSKQALEKGIANARELTEMVTKANTEAFNVINKRVTESFDEVREFAKKRTAAR